MYGPKYLYQFLNSKGQSAVWNDNGSVEWSSSPAPLEYSPDSWQQFSIAIERNKATFGTDIAYSVPLNFVKKSASILKSIAILQGIEEVVYLQILERQLYYSDTEYGFYYAQIAKTEIDMGAIKDNGGVTANMMDGDVSKYVKANGDKVYAIDIDVPGRKGVVMDGIVLKESSTFIIFDESRPALTVAGNHIQAAELISTDQKTTLGAKSGGWKPVDKSDVANILASGDYILQPSNQTTVVVDVDYAVTWSADGQNTRFGFIWTDASGNFLGETYYATFFSNTIRRDIKVQNFSFTIPSNSLVYPYVNMDEPNTGIGSRVLFTYDFNTKASDATPNFSLRYDYRFKSTVAFGLDAIDLFNALMDKVTVGQYKGKSDLLSNAGEFNLFFTCGDALRQLQGSQIKISINEFIRAINVPHGVGNAPINGFYVVEKKAFWMGNDKPAVQLGSAEDGYLLEPATDLMVSGVKIGWPNQNYNVALGDVNGKYEVCVTQLYDTPNTRTTKTLQITTTVRADMHGAEFARINTDGKTSVADNADNDVFVIHRSTSRANLNPFNQRPMPVTINGTIYPIGTDLFILDRVINQYVVDNNVYVKAGDTYVIDNITYTSSVSQYIKVGLIDKGSAFNVWLSPKQCLMRSHTDYLHSIMEKMDDKFLTFDSADKTSDLIILDTRPGGVSTEENGNVQISTFKPPLFKPWYFTCKWSAPAELALDIISNPVRKYTGMYDDVIVTGTAIKSAIQPSDNDLQTHQLLLVPDQDLTPFITRYE